MLCLVCFCKLYMGECCIHYRCENTVQYRLQLNHESKKFSTVILYLAVLQNLRSYGALVFFFLLSDPEIVPVPKFCASCEVLALALLTCHQHLNSSTGEVAMNSCHHLVLLLLKTSVQNKFNQNARVTRILYTFTLSFFLN